MEIRSLLVANRGEIALRVMRTAREMGIETIAVFSEADRDAPFVRFADRAYLIGPPASSESYLRMDKIVEVALQSGAQAIHPGYGFLSENADFAEKVEQAGLIFVGPTPEAIRLMGDKLSAKKAASAFSVPLVPGTPGAVHDIDEAEALIHDIGFPVLIKAAAGGGGKGMRIVHRREEFREQMQLAVSEATSAFGNGAVFVEKYVLSPRHIEVQVMADAHGNVVHLFERECSIQRRHQKVIEEAPSVVLTPELRAEMGKAAVDVARSCQYRGAGTVEFIFDANHQFYFLEMNTRLQVEHPVTEWITGVDLVREQIRVAEGKALSFKQEDLSIRGHSIELRVYAENPATGFLPDIGTLTEYVRPDGPGIRVDDGFEPGMPIPVYYDPMIAKLSCYGANREEAIERMLRAIREYRITGVETTLGFGAFAIDHPAFRSGNFNTHFVEEYFRPEVLQSQWTEAEEQAALLVLAEWMEQGGGSRPDAAAMPAHSGSGVSAWRTQRGPLS